MAWEIWGTAGGSSNQIVVADTEAALREWLHDLIQAGWTVDELSVGDTETDEQTMTGETLARWMNG